MGKDKGKYKAGKRYKVGETRGWWLAKWNARRGLLTFLTFHLIQMKHILTFHFLSE